MKKYVIQNNGEGNTKIYKELTNKQYKFLKGIFDELNDSPYREIYASWLSIHEAQNEELNTIYWENE